MNFWESLKGNKTYLLSAARVGLTIAFSMGWIDGTVYATFIGIMEPLTEATLRAGIKKTEIKVEETAVVVSKQVAAVATTTAVVSNQVAEVAVEAKQAAVASTAVAETLAVEPSRIILPPEGGSR